MAYINQIVEENKLKLFLEGSMWPKSYKDYQIDAPLIQEQRRSGKGIIGCEMHDLNGWGLTLHSKKKKKKTGYFSSLLSIFKK